MLNELFMRMGKCQPNNPGWITEQNRTEFYFDLYKVHRQLHYNIQKQCDTWRN